MKNFGHQYLNKNLNACDLESLLYELKCATNIVDAIQIAMAEGANTAECYEDALHGAACYLSSIYHQFEQQIFVEEPK